MKALSIIIILVLAIPLSSLGQSTRDADVKELERLETVWNEAHEHGDSDALEALWADDLEVAVPQNASHGEGRSPRFCPFGPHEVSALFDIGSARTRLRRCGGCDRAS